MSRDTVAVHDLSIAPDVAPVGATPLFRNQFFLGPRCPEPLLEWPDLAVADNLRLASHPDLSVTRAVGDHAALTLLGFMLDPDDPVADDRTILSRLLVECGSIERAARATAKLGGRWLLIVEREGGAHLLTDALGLRHAVYTAPADAQGVYAMSQAGLAQEFLELPIDPRAAAFLDSYTIRAQRPEYYWPGMSTPLCGLRHLLPNHVLNLRTGETRRYWPDGPLASVGTEQAVERMGRIMTGLMCAAAARFELALSVTAGIDSRLMLAAARPVKDQVAFVTVRQARMSDSNADLQVPARLLARLGLTHEVIRAPGAMSAEFSWTFKRNVYLAHDHYGPDAEAILGRFGRRKVAVTGSGAEVGRCSWRGRLPFSRRRIAAAQLAGLEGMAHPFAAARLQEWLEDVGDHDYIERLDLFEWEQGQGSWLAMTQLEFDAAWGDIFTPFNCRALLTTILGASERYRRAPEHRLFVLAAERLWPEVLTEPINPHKKVRRLRQWAAAMKREIRSSLADR